MLVGFWPAPVQAEHPSEVLIINSYHPGYAWSDGELHGVIHALHRMHPTLLPAIEYMDWKRFSTAEAEQRFLDLMRVKYGGQKLRLIITLDDKALEFALSHRDLFGGSQVPLVFGGVNYFTPASLQGQTNITGAAETKDILRTLVLIQLLQPGVTEIVGFHDQTESSKANRQALEDGVRQYAPGKKLRFIENWSLSELYEALGRLGPGTVVVSLGAGQDREGRLLAHDMEFLSTLASRCPVPIYLIAEPVLPLFSSGDWTRAFWTGVGGSLVFSDQHGELVGDMANRILAGTPADRIPIVTDTCARMAVDWRQMQRFGLSMKALPAGTEIHHAPQSFYRIHKRTIIAGLGLLVFLSVAVVVLVVNTILRRRAQRENRQLAAAAQQSSELIVTLDAVGHVKFVNLAFAKITGHTVGLLVGPDFLQAVLGVDGGFVAIVHALRSQPAWLGRTQCRRPDGALLQLSLVASAIQDEKARVVGYLLIGRDVTHEARLEQQVRDAQKMEAVGQLAGGVAHDFNNLLQIIGGHTQIALNPQTIEAERRECLDQVIGASERAAQLTRQLLAFGRRQPLRRTDTDLNDLVSHHLEMIRRIIGEDLKVDFSSHPKLKNVCVDQSQMEQVLLNLCVNARDAMPGGGRLTIALENVDLDQAFCKSRTWARPGDYVLLTVSDTGCGMEKSTLDRIFEPFFSTKTQNNKGTGLGLSVVLGIVQQHEGFIEVNSEPNKGSTFKVYLPTTDSPARTRPNAIAPAQGRLPASGTILVVEDEDNVRILTCRILVKAGYRVLTASNGAEAVAIFQKQAAEISLVLTDVLMPTMNGPQACEQMRKIRPDVPVLFCSGYSADSLDSRFEIGPTLQVIPKPFRPDQLLNRIATMLA